MTIGKGFAGAALLVGGAFFVWVGCVAWTGGTRESGGAVPPAVVIKGVPFLPQEEESCGPSSLAMLLRYLGRNADTSDILRETRTEGLKGVLITDLASAAKRRGFDAEVVALDLQRLRERFSSGVPIILLVDLGAWVWSRPHYLLAYGWTLDGVLAHSGRKEGQVIPFSTLDAQWAKMGRLALVVRRSGR